MCYTFTYITPLGKAVWLEEWRGEGIDESREYQITLPASWETCMLVKKQQLEPDMEQQTGSKSGKEYIKAEYCHLAKSWR